MSISFDRSTSGGLLLLISAQSDLEANKLSDQAGQMAAPSITLMVDVDLVNLVVTVTDDANRPVPGLTASDFRVFEDNHQETIRDFEGGNRLPLCIGMLVDSSYSVRNRLPFEEEAGIEFLRTVVRPGKDLAFVVAFSREKQLWQDYTDNIDKLSKALWGLHAGGSTLLYDAVYFACQEKLSAAPSGSSPVRRLIILFSDGEDNGSRCSSTEATKAALKSDVRIYAISTDPAASDTHGNDTLKHLAAETGGRVYFPHAENDLDSSFQDFALELLHEYNLTYTPANQARHGRFRAVRVEAVRKGLRVRTRSGYYAPSK